MGYFHDIAPTRGLLQPSGFTSGLTVLNAARHGALANLAGGVDGTWSVYSGYPRLAAGGVQNSAYSRVNNIGKPYGPGAGLYAGTVMARVLWQADTTLGAIRCLFSARPGTGVYDGLIVSANNVFAYTVRLNDSTNATAEGTTVPQNGEAYTVMGRYDGENVSIWVNGVKEGEVACTASRSTSAPTYAYCVGASAGFSTTDTCYLHTSLMAAGWSRSLTDSEIRSLSADPWQLLESQSVWISTTAAGTSYTLAHDLRALIASSQSGSHDLAASVSRAAVIAQDARTAVSTATSTSHDSRASVSTLRQWLHDTSAGISQTVGYLVSHDLRAVVSRTLATPVDLRAAVATVKGWLHDLAATVLGSSYTVYPRARLSFVPEPLLRFVADTTACLFQPDTRQLAFVADADIRFNWEPWTPAFQSAESFRLTLDDGTVLTDGEENLTW